MKNVRKVKQRTAAQVQRQFSEYRKGGKYSKVNPCLGCGKSAGIEYLSHPLTDNGEWHDHAICLCKKCEAATREMTDVNEFHEYANKKQKLTKRL